VTKKIKPELQRRKAAKKFGEIDQGLMRQFTCPVWSTLDAIIILDKRE
jgi:hypothetical protein